MRSSARHHGWTGSLWLVVALGCASSTDRATAEEEAAVREQFAALQSALKKEDTEKLWLLLSSRSQADAERAAKGIQTTYARASAEEKANQEEDLGLSGTEIAELTGKGFLKTKRFQKKYDEVPDGTIEKVVLQRDSATVHFLEADGDHEKAIFLRQDGQWKAWLVMPKGMKP